jgi:hypothetical protein
MESHTSSHYWLSGRHPEKDRFIYWPIFVDSYGVIKIASGGGQMKITMDRHQANWDMVKFGWDTHVSRRSRQFRSASEAIGTYRDELHVVDQDLPPFVVAEKGIPWEPSTMEIVSFYSTSAETGPSK